MDLKALNPYAVLAKVIAVAVLAAAIFFGVRTVLSWKEAAETNAATVKSQAATAEATSTITEQLDTATEQRQRVDVVVSQARSEYEQHWRASTDEGVATWRAQPVPVSMRNAARARRAARDRSAGVEAGSEGAH